MITEKKAGWLEAGYDRVIDLANDWHGIWGDWTFDDVLICGIDHWYISVIYRRHADENYHERFEEMQIPTSYLWTDYDTWTKIEKDKRLVIQLKADEERKKKMAEAKAAQYARDLEQYLQLKARFETDVEGQQLLEEKIGQRYVQKLLDATK
jgi:hypothetical protein